MRAAASKLAGSLLLVLIAGVARAAAITPDPWPREFTTPKGNTAVMYQPQFETFKGDTISGRAAISVLKKGETAPKFGVIFFTASVSVDRDDRSVEIRRIKVSRVRFPNITPEKEKTFAGIVEAEVPKWNLVISYDRVIENVKVAEREKKSAQGLKNDPPKVLFAEEPTVLVTLDGEPQLRDVEGAPAEARRQHGPVHGSRHAQQPLLPLGGQEVVVRGARREGAVARDRRPARRHRGPRRAGRRGAEEERQGRARRTTAPRRRTRRRSSSPPSRPSSSSPRASLPSSPSRERGRISSRWRTRRATSSSTCRRRTTTRSCPAAGSGARRSPAEAWTYVPPDSLPATFAKIPPDSDIGDMRASVPGTDEAEDAVLDAQIPQTTAVKRADAKLDVQYDGEPKFVGIEGTKTEYAINTPTSVLRIRRPLLRVRQRGVVRRGLADGPVAPRGLGSQRTTWSRFRRACPSTTSSTCADLRLHARRGVRGLHAGLRGRYPWDGTVVWGTGWYYRPWIGPTFWWPRPYTWGFHAHYTPWSGWGFGVVVELSVLQRELRLGRLVPPGRLGPPAASELGRGGSPARLVRSGRVPAADGHREQLLGQSPRRHSPARLESPGGPAASAPACTVREWSGPAGRSSASIRRRRTSRPVKIQNNIYTRLPGQPRVSPENDVTRQVPSRDRSAEQRVCGQERRGLSQDEGRLAAAHERHVEEFGRREAGEATEPAGAFARIAGRASRRAPRAAPRAGARFLGPAARRRPRAELVAPAAPPAHVAPTAPWRRRLRRRRHRAQGKRTRRSASALG